MTFRRPSGSSVYLIRLLIDAFPLAPVARPNDADAALAVREPDSEYAPTDRAEAVEALLFLSAVREILSNHALWINEGVLRLGKGYAVSGLVLEVLFGSQSRPACGMGQDYQRLELKAI